MMKKWIIFSCCAITAAVLITAFNELTEEEDKEEL